MIFICFGNNYYESFTLLTIVILAGYTSSPKDGI